MAVVTVRPNGIASGTSNLGVSPSGTANGVTSDNSDSTYIFKSAVGTASAVLDFGTTTLSASQTVRQVRVRARVQGFTNTKANLQLGTKFGGVQYFTAALQLRGVIALGEVTGSWYSTAPDGGAWTQTKINNLRCQFTDYKDGGARAYVYELYIDVDVANQATVTVSAPTGTITATSKPEVTWSVSDPDGDVASYYQVKVISSTVYSAAGFDPTTATAEWDSGQILGTDVSTTVASFLPAATYRAYVRTAKTINGTAFWSGWAYSGFTITPTPPTVPTLALTYTAGENKVDITATGAAPTGFSSQTFEIQRSDDSGATWTAVRYAGALVPNGSYEATVTDNEPPRGITVGYRVRAIGVSGSDTVASAWSSTSSETTTNDGTWVIKTVEPTSQYALDVAVLDGDSWETPEQIGVFRPLGRTYPVVVSGALQSTQGSYKVLATTTTAQSALAPLIAYQGTLLVLTPFGDQKYIRITSRRVNRGGTQTRPRYEYELGYVEISPG